MLASAAPVSPAKREAATLLERLSPAELAVEGRQGIAVERARSGRWQLAEHRRLGAALAKVGPQRPGVVDAFVLVAGLDSDAVFGREARETARVLARRYSAATRTVVLAGGDGTGTSTLPMGSIANIAAGLARIGEAMGREDVLILYLTGHGAQFGVVYRDGDAGNGVLGPAQLAALLDEARITNRLVLVSACHSGVFVPPVATTSTAIVTAAAAERTSFGCQADNDWTFFGDALINRALRQPRPFAAALAAARADIERWELAEGLTTSQPQSAIGAQATAWLAKLEGALPPATPPVGRPATDAIKR